MTGKRAGGARRTPRRGSGGGGRSPDLRAFAERVLGAAGAAVGNGDGGVLHVEPGPAHEALGPEPRRFAFDRETLREGVDAELIAPGSPGLAALVALARRSSAVTRVAYPARHEPTAEGIAAAAGLGGLPAHPRITRRQARLLRAHVLATLRAGEGSQRLFEVVWDAARGVIARPEDVPVEGPPRPLPAAGAGLATREVETALTAILAEVADRMAPQAGRLRRRAEAVVDERVGTLGEYYQELIREEGERRGEVARAAGAERARRLKVEWQRKITAERERLRLRGAVRLVALEELVVARSAIELRGDPPLGLLWDRGIGAFLLLRCARCGAMARALAVARGRAWLCRRCAKRPRVSVTP